jgi:putative spermidine/putrescine transport system substrate-binding protein
MKRRLFLMAGILMLIVPSTLLAQKNEVVVCTWGGTIENAMRKAYFEPFEKATGIKVTAVSKPTLAKLKAMVETKNIEWDVLETGSGIYFGGIKHDLHEKIDYKYFDPETLKNIYPDAKQEQGVGMMYFSETIAWNSSVFGKDNHPNSWADFWNVKKFPGPRTFHSLVTAGACWEFALLADGYSVKDLYTDPNDPVKSKAKIERALNKLKEIKPHVVKWWEQGNEPGQLLSDKEAVIGMGFSGRLQDLKQQKVPIDYTWNQGGYRMDLWAIPKGNKNYENAMKFIAFATRADRQAEFFNLYAYGPTNKDAFRLISAERAKLLPSYPENKEKQFLAEDPAWYSANAEMVIEMWNRWILEK